MSIINRRIATALLVAGTLFMEILDSTVIVTALPAIASDFNTAAAHLSLGVSAYLVALTIFIPLSGWAADKFGNRRIFCLAIFLFVIASILCAASTNLIQFTCARILQGFGGAMMVPVGRLVVLRTTPKEKLVQAIAILTWPALVAPLLGPVVGGWLATHMSWHWIFLINVPIGLIAFTAALFLIPKQGGDIKPFDTLGFALSGFGFGLFMAGMETSSREDLPISIALLLVAAGIIFLVITTIHLLRCKHPLFNLSPLTIHTFRISIAGGGLFRIAANSVPFLLPLMFQLGFGYSAVKSGSLLLWLFAGNLCMKPATTMIMNQFGFKNVLLISSIVLALTFAVISEFSASTPLIFIIVVLFISGMARSMQFTALNSISYADVPQHYMRDANTLQAVFIQMNIGLGIAMGALFLSMACMINNSSATMPTNQDFSLSFWFLVALILLSMIDTLRLPKDAGSSVLAGLQRR